jgi:hypothetical protein
MKKIECKNCKQIHLIFSNTLWIQCVCGAKYQNGKWISLMDQIIDL